MSALLNPQSRPNPTPRRAPLTALREFAATSGRRRPKLFYATIAMSIVLGIIVGQIALSVVTSSNAFEIDSLQTANKEVTRSYQQVSQQVSALSSPQHLALSAESLGMVSSSTPAYLRLRDEKIIGHPTPATRSGALLSGGNARLVPNAAMPQVSQTVNSANNSVATVVGLDGSVALPTVATIPAPKTR